MPNFEEGTIDFSQAIPRRYAPDVVVVGGGIAGVCAACAAALSGVQVLLVEHFAVLGGMATAGGVNGFCGETKGAGQVFDEILQDLERFNSIVPYSSFKDPAFRFRKFNQEILPFVLQEVVLRHGVDLLLHTRVVAAVVGDDGRITDLIVAGRSGLEAIHAKMVVDCTGDAHVAALAGCETMKGNAQTGFQLPMSYIGFLRKRPVRSPKLVLPKDYFPGPKYQTRQDLPMVSFLRCLSGDKSVKIKVPMYDATETRGLSEAEIEARRKFMRVLEYYRAHGKRNWVPSHSSPTIGIREGRRVRGLYTLTVDDVRGGRQFPDAIAVGTYSLDAHKPDDDKRTYVLPKSELNVPPYHIPLRSIVAKNCTNLLMAGRHLSADQLAMSSARVMPTCAQMGQAAGIVAAECVKKSRVPTYFIENFEDIAENLERIHLDLDLDWYRRQKQKAKTYLPKFQESVSDSPDYSVGK